MEHLMLDLETMGTIPYSAIVSIGAVYFDPIEDKLGDQFYRVIDLRSCGSAGLTMDADTVKWWMQQSEDARAMFNGSALPLDMVLMDFFNFCGHPEEHGNLKVWGNGASFDNVLLRCAYEKINITAPWKYYNDRCYRTMKSYSEVKMTRTGTHHNALDDAVSQAEHLLSMGFDWLSPKKVSS